MTKDDIMRMAREAGFNWPEIHTTTIEERLERFANLIVANINPKSFTSWQEGYEAGAVAEREECAAMFDNHNVWDEEVGERIRARGTT